MCAGRATARSVLSGRQRTPDSRMPSVRLPKSVFQFEPSTGRGLFSTSIFGQYLAGRERFRRSRFGGLRRNAEREGTASFGVGLRCSRISGRCVLRTLQVRRRVVQHPSPAVELRSTAGYLLGTLRVRRLIRVGRRSAWKVRGLCSVQLRPLGASLTLLLGNAFSVTKCWGRLTQGGPLARAASPRRVFDLGDVM